MAKAITEGVYPKKSKWFFMTISEIVLTFNLIFLLSSSLSKGSSEDLLRLVSDEKSVL
jgi:hypothetical protein